MKGSNYDSIVEMLELIHSENVIITSILAKMAGTDKESIDQYRAEMTAHFEKIKKSRHDLNFT